VTFREMLLEKRTELNMSIRAAAVKIGISHTYLTALEKGIDSRGLPATKPTPDTLKLISSAYKIDYNYLLELCEYVPKDEDVELLSSNPDIRSLARAAKKMKPNDIETLVKYAEFMFPEAFRNN